MRYNRFNIHDLRNDPRVGRWYTQLRSQPSWVWKLAGAAALVVIVVPILTLALTAAAAFAVVLGGLVLARRLGRWFGDRFNFRRSRRHPSRHAPPGRQNVHVIRIGD